LWYINAGHTPAIVHDGGDSELRATGVPFGLFSHAIHEAQVTVLNALSRFVLVSKGLADVRGPNSAFALAGVREVISREAGGAEQVCAAVLGAAEAFEKRRNSRQRDRTVLALVRL
jgi:serine phosphatase RsbU (regulator of sigma subunit)